MIASRIVEHWGQAARIGVAPGQHARSEGEPTLIEAGRHRIRSGVFTGIVERAVDVTEVSNHPGGRRLWLRQRWGDENHGESVAVNGCCLTVAEIHDDGLGFDVIPETLEKTNLGDLASGDRVHVERSLRASDRIDGHFVQGHVDGQAELLDRVATEAETRLRLRPPAELMSFVFPKGSVCLDGVSLTVASLDADTFEVALIPTTLKKTVLGDRNTGWQFNFEADVLAKGVVHTLRQMLGGGDSRLAGVRPPGIVQDGRSAFGS